MFLYLSTCLCVLATVGGVQPTGQVFPNVANFTGADLELSFDLDPDQGLYSGENITLSLSDSWISFEVNLDCWLAVGGVVVAEACQAVGNKSISITVDTGEPEPVSGLCSVVLTKAVSIKLTDMKSANLSIFISGLPAKFSPLYLPIIRQPPAQIENERLNFSHSTLMNLSYSTMNISFDLNSTLEKGMEITVVFHQKDNFLGDIVFNDKNESAMECSAPFTDTNLCDSYAGKVVFPVNREYQKQQRINLTISNYRITGPDIGALVLITNANSTFAYKNVTAKVKINPLELACCYSFDKNLLHNCTSQAKSICKSFGSNGAEFTSDGNRVNFMFQQEIYSNSHNCKDYFTPATATMMGDDPYCFMASNKLFVFYFGANPTLRSQNVYFREGAFVLARNNAKRLPELVLYVSYPEKMMPPTPLISPNVTTFTSAPVRLDCNQTQGIARRPFSCTWNWTCNSTSSEVTEGYILELNKSGNYQVNLNVTNFFGENGGSEPVSVIVGNAAQGSLTMEITPSVEEFTRSTNIVLGVRNVSGEMPVQRMYVWTVNDTEEYCKEARSRNCFIPSHTLPIGYYTVNVSLNAQSSVSKSLRVVSSPLMLLLRSIPTRVSTNTSITIDASPSYDPDQQGLSSTNAWNWNWTLTCINEKKDVCPGKVSNEKSVFSLGKLKVGNYTVEVSVAASYGRSDKKTLSFEVVDLSIPFVVIDAPVSRFSPNETNTISGKSDCLDCTFTWNASWPFANNNEVFASPLTFQSVMLTPNYLEFGRQYPFTLTVSNPSGSNTASVIVTINSPPVGGTFSIDPSEGVEMLQGFSLMARSWLDLDGDYPLVYQYFRFITETEKQAISPTMLEAEITNMIFARINKQAETTITCRVSDSLGAFFPDAKFTITLNPVVDFAPRGVTTKLLEEAKNVQVVGSLLPTIQSLLVFSEQNPSDVSGFGQKLTSDLMDILEIAIEMTPLLSTSDYIAYAGVIGNIANSSLEMSQESLEKAVNLLASISKTVVSLEKEQGKVVLETLSSLTNSSLRQENTLGITRNIQEQLGALSTALLNGTLPSAPQIAINTPIYDFICQRKLERDTVNNTFTPSMRGKNAGSTIKVIFRDLKVQENSNFSVVDSKVIASIHLPLEDSLARNNTRVFLQEIEVSEKEKSVVIETRRKEFVLISHYGRGEVGAVSAEAGYAGNLTDFGTVDSANARSLIVASRLDMSFPVSANSSDLQCYGYDKKIGSYSDSICTTSTSSDLRQIECKCVTQTTVSLLTKPNAFDKGVEKIPMSEQGFWLSKPTYWGMSVSIALVVAIGMSCIVAGKADYDLKDKMEKLKLQLQDLRDDITLKLAQHILDSTDSVFEESKAIANNETFKKKNFCELKKKWCRKKLQPTRVKLDIDTLGPKLLQELRDKKLRNFFKIENKYLSKSMRETIIDHINIIEVLEKLTVVSPDDIVLEEKLTVVSPDNIVLEEKELYVSLEEKIESDLDCKAESVSLLGRFQKMETRRLEQQLKTMNVYDLVPMDHWWHILVEKDLILNVFFYNQYRVLRVARVILLWDYILVQFVCLGNFMHNTSWNGQNQLATISSWWEDAFDRYFWLYQLYFCLLSFVWTFVLEIAINQSGKQFLTKEKSKCGDMIAALGWVMGIITMLACLIISFLIANMYKDDSMRIIKWLVVFAISLLKDVIAIFHLKGVFFIFWRRWLKAHICPCWDNIWRDLKRCTCYCFDGCWTMGGWICLCCCGLLVYLCTTVGRWIYRSCCCCNRFRGKRKFSNSIIR